jgi:hypothetical protein
MPKANGSSLLGDLKVDHLTLVITFSFDPATNLYSAVLENGARFSVAPNNVSGKLGANLDLLRQFTLREKNGEPPHPHVAAKKADFGASRDAKLIEEAIAAGRLQKVGVITTPKRETPVTLEELGL